jgi:hypothetical protein
MYSDGSFNVDRGGEDEAIAIKRLSGSTDDDDTQLVEVEIRVIRRLYQKGLRVVHDSDLVWDALNAAMSWIMKETPEDCTPDEARADTLQKVRDALLQMEREE